MAMMTRSLVQFAVANCLLVFLSPLTAAYDDQTGANSEEIESWLDSWIQQYQPATPDDDGQQKQQQQTHYFTQDQVDYIKNLLNKMKLENVTDNVKQEIVEHFFPKGSEENVTQQEQQTTTPADSVESVEDDSEEENSQQEQQTSSDSEEQVKQEVYTIAPVDSEEQTTQQEQQTTTPADSEEQVKQEPYTIAPEDSEEQTTQQEQQTTTPADSEEQVKQEPYTIAPVDSREETTQQEQQTTTPANSEEEIKDDSEEQITQQEQETTTPANSEEEVKDDSEEQTTQQEQQTTTPANSEEEVKDDSEEQTTQNEQQTTTPTNSEEEVKDDSEEQTTQQEQQTTTPAGSEEETTQQEQQTTTPADSDEQVKDDSEEQTTQQEQQTTTPADSEEKTTQQVQQTTTLADSEEETTQVQQTTTPAESSEEQVKEDSEEQEEESEEDDDSNEESIESTTLTPATTTETTTTTSTTTTTTTTEVITTPEASTTTTTEPEPITTTTSTTTTESTTEPLTTTTSTTTTESTSEPLTTTTSTTTTESTTAIKPSLELCNDCVVHHGVGYAPFPGYCDAYVQCRFYGAVPTAVNIRRCPSGSYWNQDTLNCDFEANVQCTPVNNCPNHKAINGDWAAYEIYNGQNWDRVSCPDGRTYNSVTCGCTDIHGGDDGSHENCYDKKAVPGDKTGFYQFTGNGWIRMECPATVGYNEQTCRCTDTLSPDTTVSACPNMKPIPGDKSKFMQFTGLSWIARPCPATLVYNPVTCVCTYDQTNAVDDGKSKHDGLCKATVALNFDSNDTTDSSKNHFWVNNTGVTFNGGKAYFNGKSRLTIPAFSNMDFGSTVYILIKYRHSSANSKQTLVANGDCQVRQSLAVCSGKDSVDFYAETKEQISVGKITVPIDIGAWQYAVYGLDKGTLTGSVGSNTVAQPVQGALDRRQRGLVIGGGGDCDNFHGIIDEVQVFLCKPEL